MTKPTQPCISCGATRQEKAFGFRKRRCVPCETADRKCAGCGQVKPVAKFHHESLCNECRYAKRAAEHKRNAIARHIRLRDTVFTAYGNECACCGETMKTMLCLDHVNNDGAEHRRSLNSKWSNAWANKNVGCTSIYADVIKRGFPSGFQLLCANCNTSKARNGGICQHKSEGATTTAKAGRSKWTEAPDTRKGDEIVCSA